MQPKQLILNHAFMKKNLHSVFYLMVAGSIFFIASCKKDEATDPKKNEPAATSSLLSGSQKGKLFDTGMVNDFTLASNGKEVLLLAVNNTTGMVYAIDLKDNDASQANANAIKSDVSDFAANLAATMGIPGNSIFITNMEVNPVSGAIYVLAENPSNSAKILLKATNGGKTITAVDFEEVTYSAIRFSSTGEQVNDITWGDNSLYISFNNAATFNGGVAEVKAPFTHNTNTVNRATTVYKTNQGNNYFTNAPLESMTYAEVAGTKRLLGITVCAPGYSFKTSEINGTGLLQVKEYFNLNTGFPVKVFPVKKDNKTCLIEFHYDGRIVRVGQKYLDESQTAFNQQATYLLTAGGQRRTGLTDDDVKVIETAGTYFACAKKSDSQLIVVTTAGILTTLAI